MNVSSINEYVNVYTTDVGIVNFSRVDPTLGMTESQKSAYSHIPGVSQESFVKSVFDGVYPSNYLDFKSSDSEIQKAFDVITLYNKVNSDPVYLNSLSNDDFQKLMLEYVEVIGNRRNAIDAGCFTMTDEEFEAADEATKAAAIEKSSEALTEWQERLVSDKRMFNLFAPEEAKAVQDSIDQTREYVETLFPAVGMYDDGTFYRKNPNAGLTEDQIKTMNNIPVTSAQESYKKQQLNMPSDYLMAKSDNPDMQAQFDRISLYAKLADERYLASLNSYEFNALVNDGVSAYVDYGSEFDEGVVAAWLAAVNVPDEYKQALVDKYKADDGFTPPSGVVPNSANGEQPSGSSGEKPDDNANSNMNQAGDEAFTFNDMKEKATAVFATIKEIFASSAIGAWIIDKGKKLYDTFSKKVEQKMQEQKTEQQSKEQSQTSNQQRGSEFENIIGNSADSVEIPDAY